jgi:ornithine cyclodeaminase/alanine dehydrogenase-like protein (mu-crystallin family)
MLVLSSTEVDRRLDMGSCIDAVETAFRARGTGARSASAVTGVELQSGKLHAKLATLDGKGFYAVAKINANMPDNPARLRLPAIQGVVVLFHATTGTPLAIIDSARITAIRTAAASAVAAKYLALAHASTLAMVGCGIQARAHVDALLCVRPVRRLHAYDLDPDAAEAFCSEMCSAHGLDCAVASSVSGATLNSAIVVTTTPSRRPILQPGDVSPGTFVAAVGADNEDKHEISVPLLQSSAIVVDDIEQCAKYGDLHHAIAAGTVARSDVRATLDQIVSGKVEGRVNDGEIIIFDSTGVAIEDAAAAAIVYENAKAAGLDATLEPGWRATSHLLSGQSSS